VTGSRLASVIAVLLVLAASGCTRCKRYAYEGWGRDGWQQSERVVEALEIRPGDRVADLGAGGGYFTFRLAEATRPGGVVYAVDVDRGMTDYLEARARESGVDNVEVVLAAYDDPKLPESGVDLIFTCNTYHHIEDRASYFARARRYLRPGGRVAVVEFRPEGLLQRIFPHATAAEGIRSEMEAAGFRLQAEHDFLERQSFLVFTAAAE
jgi:ubiquinone/menaquinone biosynthesis C-methylase UbiE